MRTSKFVTWMVLGAGLAASAVPALAQPPYRYESRDLRKDYARADRLRADLARDRERLERARYQGRYRDADRIARDIARDQARLDVLERDIRRDQNGYRYR
jgi:hypothetical protein